MAENCIEGNKGQFSSAVPQPEPTINDKVRFLLQDEATDKNDSKLTPSLAPTGQNRSW